MDYSKVISTVDQLVQSITEHMQPTVPNNLLPEKGMTEGEEND
jgi:hypothetical protein